MTAMSPARERALNSIKAGDVIFGVGAGGQQKIMLVYRADESHIFARHVTTQVGMQFGRDGNCRRTWDGGSCTITSNAALPAQDYEVVIGLDRKMRTGKEPADFRLSKAEIQLLLTVDDFFKARPLPQ